MPLSAEMMETISHSRRRRRPRKKPLPMAKRRRSPLTSLYLLPKVLRSVVDVVAVELVVVVDVEERVIAEELVDAEVQPQTGAKARHPKPRLLPILISLLSVVPVVYSPLLPLPLNSLLP